MPLFCLRVGEVLKFIITIAGRQAWSQILCVCVCVFVCERERVCVCVREREKRERESVCVCECVCIRERERSDIIFDSTLLRNYS